MIAHIFFYLSGFALFLAPIACKDTLDVDYLPVPLEAISDSLPGSQQADYMGIIEDYSKVNVGNSVSDGSSVLSPTDAAEIHQFLASSNKRIFILIPEQQNEREHLYKTLEATSLRLQEDPNFLHKIKYLNLDKLKKTSDLFKLDEEHINKYYLSAAHKINNALSKSDSLVIEIEKLPSEIQPKEFIDLLTHPNLILLSKNSFASLQLDNDIKSDLFLPAGLKASHTYQLMLKRFSRSANAFIRDNASKLALDNSKILSALKPKTNLGIVALFFKKIEHILDNKESKSTTIDTDIKKALASLLNINLAFIDGLNLQDYTLQQIQEQSDINSEAFTQSTTALDNRLKNLKQETTQKIKSVTFLQRLLLTGIEKIVRRSEGINNDDVLDNNLTIRIQNAAKGAMKSFLAGDDGTTVAKKASIAYAKPLGIFATAAKKSTTNNIKNSVTLRKLIDDINQ